MRKEEREGMKVVIERGREGVREGVRDGMKKVSESQ